MRRLCTLPVAFALLVVVFIVTHVVSFPGSLAYFRDVTGGQRILDLRPSFGATAVYQRLEAMGEEGRAAYVRLVYTIDLVFPLALWNFQAAWVARLAPEARRLRALPWVTLLSDLVENVIVLVLLLGWPAMHPILATSLAAFTIVKRLSLLSALGLPAALAALTRWRRRAPTRA